MANSGAVRLIPEVTAEADKLIAQQQYQKALEVLQDARDSMATPGDQAALHYTTGLALSGLGRATEATAAFRRASELFDPVAEWEKRALALEQTGGACYGRRQFREAIEVYRTALAVYRSHDAKALAGRTLRSIGNVQVDVGDKKAALETFREARKLHLEVGDQEGVALAVMNLSSLVFETEGRNGAIREYRQCVEQDGCAHHLALNNLGFLLTLEGSLEEAATTLERADKDLIERGVNDEDGGLLNLNLANVYLLQGKADAADQRIQKALVHFKNEGPSRAIELVVLANDKAREKGFEAWCLTDDGLKEAVARLSLATARVAQGRLDDALSEAQQAVAQDPQHAYVYAGLGWIHVARNETDAATIAFKRASGKEPNNAQFRQAVDLVNPYINAKIGRNDACPCRSGKKFKKCHGAS